MLNLHVLHAWICARLDDVDGTEWPRTRAYLCAWREELELNLLARYVDSLSAGHARLQPVSHAHE